MPQLMKLNDSAGGIPQLGVRLSDVRFTPKADIDERPSDVRFVPKAD
jgi:hypothetical protein